MTISSTTEGPLSGVRVIDVSTVLAGPFACQLLGDLGADVIKVEHPRLGDPMRHMGAELSGQGLWFKVLSRNKRSVGLDLHAPAAAEAFLRLAETADVIVENFRPGTLERWGVGYDAIHARNARTILVSITGFGQSGPYAERPAFGTLAEAMSGVATIAKTAEGKPVLPIFGLADSVAGMAAAIAAVSALYHVKGTKADGQHIDMTLVEPLLTLIGAQPTIYSALGSLPVRGSTSALRDLYLTKDNRWVAISATTLESATRVMHVIGRQDLTASDWFATGVTRAEHDAVLAPLISDWIKSRPRDEVIAAFVTHKAAIAPVYEIDDILTDEHFVQRGVVTAVDDPELGLIQMQSPIFRMPATPTSIRHSGRTLGADTDEVLIGELGYTSQEVADMRAIKAIA